MLQSTRRQFIRTAALAGAAASLPIASSAGALGATSTAAPRPARVARAGKRILILGGTTFVGPALVEAAKARGHTLTLFNRGQAEKRIGMIDGVEHRYGNRFPEKHAVEDDPTSPLGLESLKDGSWDAVVDTSGQYRRVVKASAELLAPKVSQYVYISSISVYEDTSQINADETAKVHTLLDPDVETMGQQYENYGGLKALCEKTVEGVMPGRATAIRPGLIVGPGDQTDRFTYWPVRIKRGGETLAPGTPDDPIQIIDVRDLAKWIVHVIENSITGTFDAVGPPTGLTMGKLLAACKEAASSDASPTWGDADFLEEQNVHAWSDMPVWVPPRGDSAGFHRRTIARATAAGLTFRPVLETARDTLKWFPGELERRTRITKELIEQAVKDGKPEPKMPDPARLRAGITPEREAEVLAAWHRTHGA